MSKELNKDGKRVKINIFNFDENGISKTTGTMYNTKGYDVRGFNKEGIHVVTNTIYDERGFDINGINKETGLKYDKRGFDVIGLYFGESVTNPQFFDVDGRYKGFSNENGKMLYNKRGYNFFGFDKDGYDQCGVNLYGTQRKAVKKYNRKTELFEKVYIYKDIEDEEYDEKDENPYIENNDYNEAKINNEYRYDYGEEDEYDGVYDSEENILFDDEYDDDGKKLNIITFPDRWVAQIDEVRIFSKDGYDQFGFNKDNLNKKTGTHFDKDGFNLYGYNEEWKNKYGIDDEITLQQLKDLIAFARHGDKELSLEAKPDEINVTENQVVFEQESIETEEQESIEKEEQERNENGDVIDFEIFSDAELDKFIEDMNKKNEEQKCRIERLKKINRARELIELNKQQDKEIEELESKTKGKDLGD